MKALGLIGASGSGKTTLLTALIGVLNQRGFSVSSIKHTHEQFELDRPGKDSWRHAEAGAREVILANADRFALFGPQPASLTDLLARLAEVDIVLVEGFKAYRFPKLEIYRAALGKTPLWPGQKPGQKLLAVASDSPLAGCPLPVLPLNEPGAIADFILPALGLPAAAS